MQPVIQARPHKRSDANLKHLTSVGSVNANPNRVRVQAGIQSFFTWLEALDPGLRRGDDALQHVPLTHRLRFYSYMVRFYGLEGVLYLV